MQRYKIAVFVRPGIMTDKIRNAWAREGCELLVRDDYPAIEQVIPRNHAGALLDIKMRPGYLFDLSERLTMRSVPHVFVVPDEAPGSHYSLNGGPESIRLILDELLYQDDSGDRH
ncbi:hypothetical protein [Rhizobium sp. SSA_523]|uniref:hypothetical protein n=1 Tax=Rhizobium sp. SSA_523 TaxID=2952477 RepID=UPI002091AB8F|nr:hypothetical protein [Rhizobium sp. SSA_523]MCO5733728.1 hypothetical protein [Rhizobium sp. SSA_523]WKC24997.1 hypothetical protein QTJ18_13410 [Rhizobium sp. SSA_523]